MATAGGDGGRGLSRLPPLRPGCARGGRGATRAPALGARGGAAVAGCTGGPSAEPSPRAARVGAARPAGPQGAAPARTLVPTRPGPTGPSGPDVRGRRGLGPCHGESPGAAATPGEGRGQRPLKQAVDRPSSPASGREPRVSSAAVCSRGARPARPFGSEAPPPPRSLPSPHSLVLERAQTPTPQRARAPSAARPYHRALAWGRPLWPRARALSSACRRPGGACRQPGEACAMRARALRCLTVAPGLPSKPQIFVSAPLWWRCRMGTTLLVVLADVASVLDLENL